MVILKYGVNLAAIIDKEELSRFWPVSQRGEIPSDLLCKVLKEAGAHGAKCICADMFCSKSEALLFLRLGGECQYFAFSDFEDVIGASFAASDTLPSRLYYADGRYILFVRPVYGEDVPWRFYELGTRLYGDEGYCDHLNEHGRLLIKSDAVHYIKETFSKKITG